MTARRTTCTVTWETVDITRDLTPHLRSLSYADVLSGAADELELELEDRDGLWSGAWQPRSGDTVVARLAAEPWLTSTRDVRLGKFVHDKIALRGGSDGTAVTLACVSAPLATGLRRRKRTRAWSRVTLRQMAQDIATRSGLTLSWDGAPGRVYRQRKQDAKSDLEFLEEAAKQVGRIVKVTEDQIVVRDELTIDKGASVGEIDPRGGNVLSWEFDADDSDRYGSVVITFFDPVSGREVKGQYTDPSNPDGQSLELRLGADSAGQAGDWAKGLLRNANKFATRGKLSTMGDPGLHAGVVFELVNARGFNGRYVITRAQHSVSGGGYTCDLEVRRCMEAF